jgi:hypothetical protein
MASELLNHPEWDRLNSLTSPADRGEGTYKSDIAAPHLTEEQAQAAIHAQSNLDNIRNFPRLERQYADPPITLQTYGLISFVPSKGATPDKDGIYGFMKIRGNFATTQEASERAEFLIRNTDSYHTIFHAYVGRPFPITIDQKYAAKTEEIDIRKKAIETVSDDIRAKKEKEKKDIEDLKRREKQLLAESKPDYKPDPYEEYTVLRVKKAQLHWAYVQTQKKMDEMKASIIRTREQIKEMDGENPDFAKDYFDRYVTARRDAGIPDELNSEENFMKYMVEDVELDF